MTDSGTGGADDPFDGSDEIVGGTPPEETPESIADDVRHEIDSAMCRTMSALSSRNGSRKPA